ncbi:tRNA pseudouridine synthase B [Neolewinella xylanilytica]|uniref:tRNA pseudouridine synthase B n=1 Tax=Neolewinella xylanilytica TaxID=1514080 RepID=A0A2S6I5D4_9BACT|nr:tRNA pseudouridine(55) synthase TruB [Neolewinella xylanilytica]PPK86378.1 tRNA pseudouridine synthase B [Neolewinella xylanilytica]
MLPASDAPPFSLADGALFLVDKPQGWTSFDVVNKVRYRIRKKLGVKKFKVGHAGTLDPMATGLLNICVGKWTKRLGELEGLDKSYTGTIQLGASTPSYDAETDPDAEYPTAHIDLAALRTAAAELTGPIQQVPPMYSALKVDGQPLYKRARRGETIEVKPRPVTVHHFDLENFTGTSVDFSIGCSKGTYIRSLAHDLGRAVGSGGYLTALRRTEVGPYHIDTAWQLEELLAAIDPEA